MTSTPTQRTSSRHLDAAFEQLLTIRRLLPLALEEAHLLQPHAAPPHDHR